MKGFFADLGRGITSVFRKGGSLFESDGIPPLGKAIPFGIQHILAMFVANVTPILIVLESLGLQNSDVATQAMLGALFMAGLGTAMQLLMGARLPIVIGTSFTFVGVFCTVGASAGGGEAGYYTILGSVLAGGLISTFLCLFVRWWGKLIKPVVPCVVVFAIGLSLLNSGATQFIGGEGALAQTQLPYFVYPLVAAATLAAALLWQLLAKGVWKNLNVVFGIAVGYLICLCIPDMIDFSAVKVTEVEDVITYPHLADVTKMKFEAVPIALTTAYFLMSVVEGIGDCTALCTDVLGRQPTTREITGTVVTDGFNSVLCSLFGALPLTTFAQNVGIVTQTKVVNRFTVLIGAVLLLLVSLFPVAANVLLTIPQCVLGGAMVILFGSIAVVGIKMFAKAGFSQKNVLILSLSLCLGFGITLVPQFFEYLRSSGLNNLADMLSNNVLNMFVIAFVLSWVLPDDMDISFKRKKQGEE